MCENSEIFEVSIYPVFQMEDGSLRETSVSKLFRANSNSAAHLAGLRHAKRIFVNCGELHGYLRVGCVKIYTYNIREIDNEGYCHTGVSMFPILEWKCDTGLYNPAFPVEELRQLVAEVKALSKADWAKYETSAEEAEVIKRLNDTVKKF